LKVKRLRLRKSFFSPSSAPTSNFFSRVPPRYLVWWFNSTAKHTSRFPMRIFAILGPFRFSSSLPFPPLIYPLVTENSPFPKNQKVREFLQIPRDSGSSLFLRYLLTLPPPLPHPLEDRKEGPPRGEIFLILHMRAWPTIPRFTLFLFLFLLVYPLPFFC